MSNKIQLQTNNTALDGYIARINAAKEVAASLPEAGGGSGGGSVETCTLTVLAAGTCYVQYVTSDSTGNIHTEVTPLSVRHSELPVVCGSHISIIGSVSMATTGEVSVNGAELILQKNWGSIFRITAAVGGSASINIILTTV